MDKINLDELSDYQEDLKGLSNFQRSYLIPSLLGFAIAVAGFILVIAEMEASHYHRGAQVTFLDNVWFHFEKITKEVGVASGVNACLPAAIFAGGLALLAVTMFFMSLVTPISSISSLKMEKYWNANPRPGDREIIYVDRSSKTYFRRVFSHTTVRTPFS